MSGHDDYAHPGRKHTHLLQDIKTVVFTQAQVQKAQVEYLSLQDRFGLRRAGRRDHRITTILEAVAERAQDRCLVVHQKDAAAGVGRLPRGNDPLVALAEPVLSLLAQYGAFRTAGLYRVSEGLVAPAPLSAVGEVGPMSGQDLLMRMCLQRGELVSIREQLLERGEHRQHSQYQLCVPLIDTEGRILAVLAVEQMPFFAFNDRVFGLLAILAGHIADLILNDPKTLQLQDLDSQEFSKNLKRSLIDAQRHGLDASLFALEVTDSSHSDELLRLIEGSRRGLDLQLKVINQRANTCVLVLLPLTSSEGAQGYLFRLSTLLSERFGVGNTLESLQVRVSAHDLGAAKGNDALHHFLYNECALNDQQVAI
jgi:hypothetical protein